jgi:hypothetical protein
VVRPRREPARAREHSVSGARQRPKVRLVRRWPRDRAVAGRPHHPEVTGRVERPHEPAGALRDMQSRQIEPRRHQLHRSSRNFPRPIVARYANHIWLGWQRKGFPVHTTWDLVGLLGLPLDRLGWRIEVKFGRDETRVTISARPVEGSSVEREGRYVFRLRT